MRRVYWGICGILLYMEIIYHMASFGMKEMNPILLLPLIMFLAGVETMAAGIGKKRINNRIFWCLMAVNYLIYACQLVYVSIFQQPMLLAVTVNAGQDALTDFWREALSGILHTAVYLLLLAVPLVLWAFLQKKSVIILRRHKKKNRIRIGIPTGIGLVLSVLILIIGYYNNWNLYEEYQGFYDPSKIISAYGVMPTIVRDLFGDLLPAKSSALEAMADASIVSGDDLDSEDGTIQDAVKEYGQNVLEIDFDKLKNLTDTDLTKQLASYMESMTPTNQNEYTGMFEGYNLIYLTAEGFSQYAIDETLTPTLYKLTHSGFVIDDYYVPLWQTSTSDGEYVNMFGLIPDQQLSFRRTQSNALPYSLPAYFAKEGVTSYAYHNNSLTYYDRHLTHPNMGYIFKAAKLGKLTQEEGGASLFPIATAESWPQSDLEMIQATLPEYINQERFHAYYMTVSGHMDYTFEGNEMSKKNQELVASLPYSDEVKAYIACNIELDRALEYLIAELEKAGKLDNTVIAMSADHYPYGLEMDKLEELAGKELEGTLDLYRNSLILWNSKMETVKIEKTCSALDLLPTLYNLFGFEYDSRLFAGKDMLSDSESLVVFSDRSFITDKVIYNSESGEKVSRTGEPVDETYFEQMKTAVKGLFEYSAGILNGDFYRYVDQAVTWKETEAAPTNTPAVTSTATATPTVTSTPSTLAGAVGAGAAATDVPTAAGTAVPEGTTASENHSQGGVVTPEVFE